MVVISSAPVSGSSCSSPATRAGSTGAAAGLLTKALEGRIDRYSSSASALCRENNHKIDRIVSIRKVMICICRLIATHTRAAGARANCHSLSAHSQPTSSSKGLSLLGSRIVYKLGNIFA